MIRSVSNYGNGTLIRKGEITTKKHYQEIVGFADDFLQGGRFDLYVEADSRSQTIRIDVVPKYNTARQIWRTAIGAF